MSAFLNVNQIKEQVSITDLLARLGHNPAYKSGKELFYHSMLREEKTPSFCVNEQLGVWYDHGGVNLSGIKGGNIIDLGIAYWHPLSFAEVLQKIRDICQIEITGTTEQADQPRKIRPRNTAVRVPNYKIEEIKPLGSSQAITDYLQYRGVWETAISQLNEVHYYVEDQLKNRKQFFAAGWRNENDGWEVRNKYFKGCLGKKGMTFISGDSRQIAIFEGFTDYLSWKAEYQGETPSILILNTLSFIKAAIKRAADYNQVAIYFDHDIAGTEATKQVMASLPQAIDRSALYQGYNDYNDKRMADQTARLRSAKTPNFFADLKVSFSR